MENAFAPSLGRGKKYPHVDISILLKGIAHIFTDPIPPV